MTTPTIKELEKWNRRPSVSCVEFTCQSCADKEGFYITNRERDMNLKIIATCQNCKRIGEFRI